MLAVRMAEKDIQRYFKMADRECESSELAITCINSSKSVTVAGSRCQIDLLKSTLDAQGIFARILPVNGAYHSSQTISVATKYRASIGDDAPEVYRTKHERARMFSSLTGAEISRDEVCSPRYWVDNMTCPVRLSSTVQAIVAESTGRSSDMSYSKLH